MVARSVDGAWAATNAVRRDESHERSSVDDDSRKVPIRPVRAVFTALVGGGLGAVGVGFAAGQAVAALASAERGAWAGLAAAIVGAAAGAFAGAAVAVALVFRHEPRRARVVTVLTVLVGGPLLLLLLAAVGNWADRDWFVPPLWLALSVGGSALAGRWIAGRSYAT